jgi:glycosyltransferase involved in cell wall biosynthesis
MRVHVEYAHSVDPVAWERSHSEGCVPDRLPYGLDRVSESGVDLVVRPASSRPLRLLNRAARFSSGGFDFIEAARCRARRACDVALCWDERSGVPASLRSRLPGEPRTATGVIWITERDVPAPRRAQLLAARALRSAAAVWAMSPPQLPILAEDWGVPRSRVHLLHMGIDVDFWRSDAEPSPELVVSAGNDRNRDHVLLVEAIARLRRRRPSVRLELVTHLPVSVPAELGSRRPSLTHPEMRELYGRASVVAVAVKPNLHISGLSVLLEAMACGRAVVMTESPGLSEYLQHGETGVIVPQGDADALSRAVEALLAEPARAAALGAAARATVARFSTAYQATVLEEIVRGCL